MKDSGRMHRVLKLDFMNHPQWINQSARHHYCSGKALLLFYEKVFRTRISYYFTFNFQSVKPSGSGHYADELQISLFRSIH